MFWASRPISPKRILGAMHKKRLGVGFEVRKVGGVLRKDGTETLDLQFVPVNPEPKMFVPPQAQKTMHRILTENETSAQPWLREPGD